MRLFLLLTACCACSFALSAQAPQWLNYSADDQISHFCFEKNYTWICTKGGLVRLGPNAGDKQVFRPWNSGLRGLFLHEAVVDQQGVKWVAGEYGGLFRYDDSNWQTLFETNTGDSLHHLRRLRAGKDGMIWFLSLPSLSDQKATCYSYNGTAFSKLTNPSNLFNYSDLAVDNSGVLWVATGYELYRFDDPLNPQQVYNKFSGPILTDEGITAMAFDQQNNLYISTARYTFSNGTYTLNCRLLRYDGTSWKSLGPLQTGIVMGYVTGMYSDDAGNFWVVSGDNNQAATALLRYDGTAWKAFKVQDLNAPAGNGPYKVAVSPGGTIWASIYPAASPDRVFEYDWNGWQKRNTTIDPLPNNWVNDVAFDQQNRIWFGGHNLLTRYDGQNWKSYTAAEIGLGGSYFSAWSLSADPEDGSVWMAFYDNNDNKTGFSQVTDATGFSNFQAPGSYDAFRVLPLPGGKRWVVAVNSLGYFNGITWTWYNASNAPFQPFDGYLDATPDLAGNLWANVDYDTIARFDGADWTIFDSTNMPLKPNATWVYADRAGNTWTANAQTLLRYDGNSWQTISIPGLPANTYSNAMVQDTDGSYWIATSGGVLHWDGFDTWTHYHSQNSPLGQTLTREIRIDAFGNKWFIHDNAGSTEFNANGIAGPSTVGISTPGYPGEPEDGWLLYPNPAGKGPVRLKFPERDAVSCRLLDQSGRQLRTISCSGGQGYVDGLQAGFYFVCPEGGKCRKLVVLR